MTDTIASSTLTHMLRATLAVVLVALAMACEDPVPAAPDAPEGPAGPLPIGDDAPDNPVVASARAPSPTSGGGAAASAAHHVQLSVGAPIPRGDATSAQSRLRLEH